MESAGVAAGHGQVHITALLVGATGPRAEEDDFVDVIESSIAADFVFQGGVKVHGEPPLYLGMWDF